MKSTLLFTIALAITGLIGIEAHGHKMVCIPSGLVRQGEDQILGCKYHKSYTTQEKRGQRVCYIQFESGFELQDVFNLKNKRVNPGFATRRATISRLYKEKDDTLHPTPQGMPQAIFFTDPSLQQLAIDRNPPYSQAELEAILGVNAQNAPNPDALYNALPDLDHCK